jgi:heterodisulfide reductase subunit A-like polyferredoxin
VEFGADIPEHFTISEVTIPLMVAGSELLSACSDVLVIGSGPNGLAVAITLAQAGHAVTMLEGAPDIGGGTRSAEVTLPGFVHDLCSAVHPLAVASPFFPVTGERKNVSVAGYRGIGWVRGCESLALRQ